MTRKINKIYSLYIRARAVMITLTTSSKLIWLNLSNKNATKKQFDAILNQWSDNIINLISARVTVNNPFKVKIKSNQRYIIMCNHSSLLDIPISYKAFPESSIRMLAKKELSKIPIFGRSMKAASFPFVERQNRKQAIKDLDFAKKLMLEGIVLWIAPEGTRSKDGLLHPFKKGAFITAIQSEAIIIPLAIKGAFDTYHNQTNQISLDQDINLNIGEPIDAKLFSMAQKDELKDKAQQVMEKLLS